MTETLKNLQDFIAKDLDLEYRYQRLICMGRELKDPTAKIHTFVNKNNPVVHLLMNVRGG